MKVPNRKIQKLKAQRHIFHICEIMEYVEAHYQENTNQREIAKQMGFSDVTQMSTAFKKQYGVTPSQYRRRLPTK